MNGLPRVSVILNSYNQADYIRASVESVLAQTYDDFELIVTDNGSTDQTQSILRQYEGHPKVKLNLCTDNQTVSQRFNQAVALASGEFVAFLYSDDWFLPFKLEHQVSLFDQLGPEYGLIYAPLHVYNQTTKKEWDLPTVPAAEDSLKALLTSRETGAIDMISPMIRRECFIRHKFLDEVFAEGEGIFLRVALTHKFHYDPRPVAVSRDTGENRGKAVRKNVEMHWQTLVALEADPAYDKAKYGHYLRIYKSTLLRNVAWCNLRLNGPAGWSYSKYLEAMEIQPKQLFHKRTLIGLLVGLLPASLRSRFNRFADRQMGVLVNSTVVETYGGSS